MKVAVFGYGSMGTRHAKNALALGHEVRVHDPQLGLGSEGDLHERETMRWAEAVVIATPAATHARLLWSALWLSRPVYVEKPLVMNSAQVDALADRFNVSRVTVGYNLRTHPHVAALKQWLDGRTPAVATFYTLSDMATWPGRTYADTLLECSHEIDLALWMLGPARVRRAEHTQDGRRWVLTLAHDAGTESLVQLGTDSATYSRGAVVYASGATAGWTWNAPARESTYSDPVVGLQNLDVDADDTYRAALAAFLVGAATPDPAPVVGCTFAEAAHVLAVCDAARAAAQIC